jgi:hypothetical protein
MSDVFSTRQASLAAFLHYCGCQFRATRKVGQYSFMFEFADVARCKGLESDFYAGIGVTCARTLLECDREVKQTMKWAAESPSGEWQ